LLQQSYPLDKYEIVVVDGGSRDRTQGIVKEIEKKSGKIRMVIEPKKGTAAGRNAGVKSSRYDYVAFIDADCEAPSEWLATLVKKYQAIRAVDKNVIAVGGTNIPPKSAGDFVKAIGIASDSYLGSFFSAQGRRFTKPVYVKSLANLNVLYEKQKIIEIGYYDESLGSEAEDADINYRLNAAGYRFLFIPDSFVWHKLRPTPKTWLTNMFRYGRGRARLLKRHPGMWGFYYIAPLVFITLLSVTALFPLSHIFLLPLLYFPILFFYALFQSLRKKSPLLALHVMLALALKHFGYASGEAYGFIDPRVR
jgi:glycosyltransferase involved in cell wall biosynthesis